MDTTIVIEGKNIHDIPSFYGEINRVFMENEDWKIGESLDALNDLMRGGFGKLNTGESFQLVWNNIDIARECLGMETTRKFYQSKIDNPEVFNKHWAEQKLQELENGEGQTYFEIILEIINEHPNIRFQQY